MNAICCKGEKRDVRFTKRALESEEAADTSSCEASFSFLFFSSSLPHLHLFLGGKWVEVGQEFACLPACLPACLVPFTNLIYRNGRLPIHAFWLKLNNKKVRKRKKKPQKESAAVGASCLHLCPCRFSSPLKCRCFPLLTTPLTPCHSNPAAVI